MSNAKDVRGDLLMLGRGKVSLNLKSNVDGKYGGEFFLGNCPDFSAGITDDRKTKRSSATAAAPIIADALLSRDLVFGVTLDEWDENNVAVGLMSALGVFAQGAITGGTLAFFGLGADNAVGGRWYQVIDTDGVDVRQLTALTITGGTLGTDFLVDQEAGRVFIVDGGALDGVALTGTFDADADTSIVMNLASEAKLEGFLRFVGDPAIGPYYEAKLWNVSIQPDGDVGFIGEDFGSFKLKVTVKDDSANHPTHPLGQVIKRVKGEPIGDAFPV